MMIGIPLIQFSRPSYHQGYVRSAIQSRFPSIWSGLELAWIPILGPTGLTARDVSGHKRDGVIDSSGFSWGVFSGIGYGLERAISGGPNVSFAPFLPPTGTGARTITTWFIVDDASRISHLWGYGTSAVTQECSMGVNQFSGTLFVKFGGSGNTHAGATDVTGAIPHVVTYRHDGATIGDGEIWLDGALELDIVDTDGINTGTTVAFTAGDTVLIGGSGLEGKIFAIIVHNRRIGDSELKLLHNDPICFLRFVEDIVGFVAIEEGNPQSMLLLDVGI